jgi:hypothetical protein
MEYPGSPDQAAANYSLAGGKCPVLLRLAKTLVTQGAEVVLGHARTDLEGCPRVFFHQTLQEQCLNVYRAAAGFLCKNNWGQVPIDVPEHWGCETPIVPQYPICPYMQAVPLHRNM